MGADFLGLLVCLKLYIYRTINLCMRRIHQALTGLLMLILGFTLNGLAWTVLPGPVWSTIVGISGLVLMFVGLILLLLSRN